MNFTDLYLGNAGYHHSERTADQPDNENCERDDSESDGEPDVILTDHGTDISLQGERQFGKGVKGSGTW